MAAPKGAPGLTCVAVAIMNAAPDRIVPAGRQIASTPRDLGTFLGLLSRYDTEESCVGLCIIVVFIVEMRGCSRGSQATSCAAYQLEEA